jgi:crossover junction endodeoxyribonuclease RuvC
MAIILGIDPGSQKTGFRHYHTRCTASTSYITSGVIRLRAGPLPERLRIDRRERGGTGGAHGPTELSIEQVFMARSADAALKLGQARGAAIVPCVTARTRGQRVFGAADQAVRGRYRRRGQGAGAAHGARAARLPGSRRRRMPPMRSPLPCAMRTRGRGSASAPAGATAHPPGPDALDGMRKGETVTNRAGQRCSPAYDRSYLGHAAAQATRRRSLSTSAVWATSCRCPMTTLFQLPALGETVTLVTHHAVREDAHTLYGFAGERDRELFRHLIRVNGVGPKLALTILSGMDARQLCARRAAPATCHALVALPGVGKKTAERLLVEMRDKLSGWLEQLGETVDAARAGSTSLPAGRATSWTMPRSRAGRAGLQARGGRTPGGGSGQRRQISSPTTSASRRCASRWRSSSAPPAGAARRWITR